jgi:hypothetical protein
MTRPRPGPWRTASSPSCELAVLDHQGVGEEVVGQVEVVGELGRPAGGERVGGAEGDGAQGPHLGVYLVAEDDLDAQPLAQAEHQLAGGEPGP